MFIEFISNKIVISIFFTIFISHLIKFIINSSENKKLEWWSWIDTGGMPSSHSAITAALAISIGIFEGINSTLFIVAFIFAGVTIRDAIGVRRTVDKLISCVNKIVASRKIKVTHIKTIAGHTPIQVLIGASLGILVPIIVFFVTKSLGY
ncbi:divergent PAP2 family protein [Candidatus Woesearchaeota archaeon]|nr:divergent PAP2 family protein [Candidatus Woesearchaeota archaeon]MBT6520334.1 divergent PAP2 family protein [Candidatus Woesearchaeota archaeon]MBT7368287.1 divergent PAP2 family protein [Candidatus Woesearchaeota archaeon]